MQEEQKKIEAEDTEEFWLVFKLMKQNFAVNCHDVMGIFIATDEVTHMSGYSSHVRGVIDYRGITLPLLELRSVLGMMSFEQESAEFNDMIGMRIGDHQRWVQELDRCVNENEEFTLAKDPHKCAFGKWYYGFETSNQAVAFDINKIEEPHRKLHELAEEIFGGANFSGDEGEKKNKQLEILNVAETKYMPQVISLLEDLESVYKSGYREMCISIKNDEDKMLGLLVDEVTVVEKLAPVNSKSLFSSAFAMSCVNHVARADNVKGEIFVLDREALFNNLF